MMTAFLMTSWLCLPLAPLNPIEEDTLASISLHFTVGVTNPNGIVTAEPLVSAKYEMLVLHPLMVRGTVDFKYGRVTSHLYPNGHLYSMLFGVDAIYYRGTDHLTGYIGLGPVLALHHFKMFDETADSSFATERITAIDMQERFGYRLTLGLRYRTSYSLEIAVVELYPDFKKIGIGIDGSEIRSYQTIRTSSFQITFGYLFEI
ncbi:MAG: hypothetical protein J7J98_06665 [candidate division Zixibacteria bacterium]|nr:hypothetical protein [candidate division Zixibacteria bacterium]